MNDPRKILAAVSHGMVGEHEQAMDLLRPMVQTVPDTFALLSALAETAAHRALRENTDGTAFAAVLERTDGQDADPEDAPPAVLFAARFVTAWANRDIDTALALLHGLIRHDAEHYTAELADAIGLVFAMAVETAKEIAAGVRADSDRGESPFGWSDPHTDHPDPDARTVAQINRWADELAGQAQEQSGPEAAHPVAAKLRALLRKDPQR